MRLDRGVPMRSAARRTLALAAALLLLPGALAAQSLTAAAGGFSVQRRVHFASGASTLLVEQTGTMVGGAGSLRLGPLGLDVSGWMGTLKGSGDSLAPDAKARTTAFAVQLAVAPYILVGARYEVRRFETDAGVTMWTLMGGTARVEPSLGLAGLRGVAEVAISPASTVSAGPKLTMAMQATVGLALAPADGALRLRLAYRFERYDIAATALTGERYEQFRGVVAEVGLSVGRH